LSVECGKSCGIRAVCCAGAAVGSYAHGILSPKGSRLWSLEELGLLRTYEERSSGASCYRSLAAATILFASDNDEGLQHWRWSAVVRVLTGIDSDGVETDTVFSSRGAIDHSQFEVQVRSEQEDDTGAG
jgi:hypothetical protein